MTKQEQMKFVNELISNTRNDLLTKMNKQNLPTEWDGIELRQLVIDEFSACVWKNMTLLKRIKDYNNYKLVNGF